MKKRGLSLLLALCMVLGMVTALPEIASAATNGILGDNITWTFDNGILTLTGNGEMITPIKSTWYGDIVNFPWGSFRKNIKEVIVNEGITKISYNAFYCFENLTNVKLPQSLSFVDADAFYRCENLEDIIIPDGTKSIGGGAFQKCSKLKNVSLPRNMEYINSYAFSECRSLERIVLSSKIINNNTFQKCTALKEIVLYSDVTSISDYAFYDCTALTDVYYSGSEDDWKKINIGTNNECLTNATIHYQYKPKDHAVDDYIIAEVSKYTSDGEYTQLNRIMSSGASAEEKFRRLNELFANNGITDVKEGIKYLSETTSYRSDYNYLTTNEIYCAYNFYDWLYSTKTGLAARSALYTDGLIFNYEVSAYLNPATYIESEYPGVKKNKTMLKKFLESGNDSAVNDIFDYTNKTAKYMKNIIKLNNIAEDAEMDSLMNQIMNCKSPERLEVLQNQFAEKIAYQIKINSGDKVYLDGENFSDALSTSASIISFAGATADDIAEMIKMNDNIETYKKNKKFLTYIYSNKDVSAEMRIAAYQLLDDINNGYYKRVVSIFGNVFELADGFIYTDKSKIRYALEQMGVSESGSGLLTDAFATLKLAAFISNIVADAGDFVKQAAYTQGYAELSALYAMKLEDDKKAFLADKSAENAWTFFEDYTILWNLRYRGEQQYFDMNKIKMYIFARVKTFNYQLKNEVVSDTLAHLEQCKFSIADGIEIPKSVQYVKKSVVKCPVDVAVYSLSGDLIAELKDGIESDISNEYGRFVVVRESYSGEYSKIICQSTNDELKIKLSAVGDGLVDYQSSSADAENIKAIDKLLVDNGNVIYADDEKFSVDTDGDGAADVYKEYVEKSNDEYVRAESAELSCDSLNLIEGETKTIGIEIFPINTTNTTVDWFSTDRSVADVKNGAVTAVGGGDAEIHVKVCDSDIEIVVPIRVTPLRELNFETAEFGDKQVRVKVIASTILEDIQSGRVLLGLYENNRLVGVHEEDVSVNNKNAQSVEHVFDTEASDSLNVKAFWWGIDDMIRPLSRSEKAVNSDETK